MKSGFILIAVGGLAAGAGPVHAQGVWSPINVVGGPTNIITAGSLTYAQYAWTMAGCMELFSEGPVIAADDQLSFDFSIGFESGVPCPQFVFADGATAVLGALAPGDYTLTTTSWAVPVATNRFTVPRLAVPTLQPGGFAADGSFQLRLNGVSTVNYILQRSTDLVAWTTLSTNAVGAPLRDPAPVVAGRGYYRVQVVNSGGLGPP